MSTATEAHSRHHDQILREKAARDIALGRRLEELRKEQGHTATVVKRWVNGAVVPVANRMRRVAEAYLGDDTDEVCRLLDSPLFGLAEIAGEGHHDLKPVMAWLLKGSSPGRRRKAVDGASTYADDIVLAAVGVALERLVRGDRDQDDRAVSMAGVLILVADAIRETCIGQFLTQVQGAQAMAQVRKTGGKSAWSQRGKLDQVAQLMGGQVRSTLEAEGRGEIDLEEVGSRRVLRVTQVDREGKLVPRRISLRPPEAGDFDLLKLASRTKGERDTSRQLWASVAMMVLCAAQVEGGLFEIAARRSTKAGHRPTKCLGLSDAARGAVAGDVERWLLAAGMVMEPMVCPPVEGDYLTVRHRAVTGRQGPLGWRTDAAASGAWAVAADVLAGSAWSVPGGVLKAIREDERIQEIVASKEPDEARRTTVLGAYRRVAGEAAFWLPIQMDFRGRAYPKTTWVTYQGTDLQKGLMCWPQAEVFEATPPWQPIVLHCAALYGHGLDKGTLSERTEWWRENHMRDPAEVAQEAEEPLALLAALQLYQAGQADRIACQIDGTCNGLQHLTALMGDEAAAPWVNLCGTSYEDRPSDLYVRVAESVSRVLHNMERSDGATVAGWRGRMDAAQVQVTRKLCKKPVMVLPYGGTRMTIMEAVTSSVLDQSPDPRPWLEHPDYAALKDRPLKDHPLFRADCRELGGIVYDAIREVIPRAMSVMDTFRAIAKGVGERSLEWATGRDEDALWVVHAYAQSASSRTALKGFHLPNSVRSLSMRVGKDEIDKAKHVTGIVANFIHSLDAAHLARTMHRFRALGGTSFGAIHDCLLGRPSEMHLLNRAVREAFKELYEEDPLTYPVRMRDPKSGVTEDYVSWYALAESLRVTFPERGTWRPAEVMNSAWFFS